MANPLPQATQEYDADHFQQILTRLEERLAALEAPANRTAYSPSNVTTDRTFDADSTTLAEIADVLGTLLQDLKAKGILT